MDSLTATVLVDTYNHAKFIEAAVESVLDQIRGRSDVELLVVDDGSTDGTGEILSRYKSEARVLHKDNGGQASAFNVGLREARGEIVLFLDGDDRWRSGKLSAVLAAFARKPEMVAVGHGIAFVDDRNTLLQEIAPHEESLHLQAGDEAAAEAFVAHKAFLGTSRFAARREVLAKALPLPEALVYEADEVLFTLACAAGPVQLLPEVLAEYRLHGGNLFQTRVRNRVARRRRQRVFATLASHLDERLAERGMQPSVRRVVVEPLEIEATRLALATDGGRRHETVAVERRAAAYLPPPRSVVDRLRRKGARLLAYVLSPRWYYALRNVWADRRSRG